MGYNTTVVVLNDALNQIAEDASFGKNLAAAISRLGHGKTHIDVASGGHVNAATAIETHHADQLVPLLIGGNTGTIVNAGYISYYRDSLEEALLRGLAAKLGYRVSKLPVKK